MKSAKERMDIISAYQQVGSYRAAAELCGTTHKTVKRVVEKFEADQVGQSAPPGVERAHNYDAVAELVAERVKKSQGRMSAKRMLPIARAAGYQGSASALGLAQREAGSLSRGPGRHRLSKCKAAGRGAQGKRALLRAAVSNDQLLAHGAG